MDWRDYGGGASVMGGCLAVFKSSSRKVDFQWVLTFAFFHWITVQTFTDLNYPLSIVLIMALFGEATATLFATGMAYRPPGGVYCYLEDVTEPEDDADVIAYSQMIEEDFCNESGFYPPIVISNENLADKVDVRQLEKDFGEDAKAQSVESGSIVIEEPAINDDLNPDSLAPLPDVAGGNGIVQSVESGNIDLKEPTINDDMNPDESSAPPPGVAEGGNGIVQSVESGNIVLKEPAINDDMNPDESLAPLPDVAGGNDIVQSVESGNIDLKEPAINDDMNPDRSSAPPPDVAEGENSIVQSVESGNFVLKEPAINDDMNPDESSVPSPDVAEGGNGIVQLEESGNIVLKEPAVNEDINPNDSFAPLADADTTTVANNFMGEKPSTNTANQLTGDTFGSANVVPIVKEVKLTNSPYQPAQTVRENSVNNAYKIGAEEDNSVAAEIREKASNIVAKFEQVQTQDSTKLDREFVASEDGAGLEGTTSPPMQPQVESRIDDSGRSVDLVDAKMDGTNTIAVATSDEAILSSGQSLGEIKVEGRKKVLKVTKAGEATTTRIEINPDPNAVQPYRRVPPSSGQTLSPKSDGARLPVVELVNGMTEIGTDRQFLMANVETTAAAGTGSAPLDPQSGQDKREDAMLISPSAKPNGGATATATSQAGLPPPQPAKQDATDATKFQLNNANEQDQSTNKIVTWASPAQMEDSSETEQQFEYERLRIRKTVCQQAPPLLSSLPPADSVVADTSGGQVWPEETSQVSDDAVAVLNSLDVDANDTDLSINGAGQEKDAQPKYCQLCCFYFTSPYKKSKY